MTVDGRTREGKPQTVSEMSGEGAFEVEGNLCRLRYFRRASLAEEEWSCTSLVAWGTSVLKLDGRRNTRTKSPYLRTRWIRCIFSEENNAGYDN